MGNKLIITIGVFIFTLIGCEKEKFSNRTYTSQANLNLSSSLEKKFSMDNKIQYLNGWDEYVNNECGITIITEYFPYRLTNEKYTKKFTFTDPTIQYLKVNTNEDLIITNAIKSKEVNEDKYHYIIDTKQNSLITVTNENLVIDNYDLSKIGNGIKHLYLEIDTIKKRKVSVRNWLCD